MTPEQAERRAEYERWLRGRGWTSAAIRFAMSPAGQWVVSSPLLRLPEQLNLQPEQRWLDVGCGRGSLLRLIDDRLRFTRAPIGVDFSRTALRLARRDARGSERSVDFAQATATALPMPDGTFDLLTAGYVLKHLADGELERFFTEVRRVLAPGGLALLWEFAPTGNPRLDGWNRRFLAAGVKQPHLRSTRELLRAAGSAGFDLARDAALRPFLLPPIPRASVLLGRAPEGWAGSSP